MGQQNSSTHFTLTPCSHPSFAQQTNSQTIMGSMIASLFAIYSVTNGLIPIVLPGNGAPPAQSFECVDPYQIADPVSGVMGPNPLSCAGKNKTFTNAAHKFDMTCSALGACAMTNTHFDYNGNVPHTLGVFECSEGYACYGANVFCNSQGATAKFNEVICSSPGACDGLNIYLTDCDLGDMSCPYPHMCPNCFIHTTGAPGKKPCFGY